MGTSRMGEGSQGRTPPFWDQDHSKQRASMVAAANGFTGKYGLLCAHRSPWAPTHSQHNSISFACFLHFSTCELLGLSCVVCTPAVAFLSFTIFYRKYRQSLYVFMDCCVRVQCFLEERVSVMESSEGCITLDSWVSSCHKGCGTWHPLGSFGDRAGILHRMKDCFKRLHSRKGSRDTRRIGRGLI